MKTRHPVSRDHGMFLAGLILLFLLGVILWFKDPAHRYHGKSRIDWPPPVQPKP